MSGSNYSLLKTSALTSRSPAQATGQDAGNGVILNPDNTPRNIEGSPNRVFDLGSPNGRINVPTKLVYHGAAIEGVPKINPKFQGTVANVQYEYESGGATVTYDTTISLQDLKDYKDFIKDKVIDPDKQKNVDKKKELMQSLDTLQHQMENGAPANKATGAPAVPGMYQFYDRARQDDLQRRSGPTSNWQTLDGHVEKDGRFVRNAHEGKIQISVNPKAGYKAMTGHAPPAVKQANSGIPSKPPAPRSFMAP